MKCIRIQLLVGILPPLLMLQAARAQSIVDQLIDPHSLQSDGTTLTIVFDDLRQDATAHFEAQHSDNITRWTGISDSTVTPDGNHRYTLTAPDPGTERKFYRVVSYSTSAEDADGDGLSNAFEASINTDPNDADSDNDGFSDGTEFATGTDPNDASKFPDQAHLPIVGFTADVFFMEEGSNVVRTPEGVESTALTLNTSTYVGPVNYAVAGISTATFDADHTLLEIGTAPSSGGAAAISVPLVDDLSINQTYRILFIDIKPSPGYRRGGVRRASVLIGDNDNYWHGSLAQGRTQRSFRLEILRQGLVSEVWFVAGGDHDGLPNMTDSNESTSKGVIPQGRWKAVSLTSDAAQFQLIGPSLTFPPITSDGSYKGLFDQESLMFQRALSLRSDSTTSPNIIESNRMLGTYTESISVANNAAPHLATEETGTFILLRDVIRPSDDISLPDLVAAP